VLPEPGQGRSPAGDSPRTPWTATTG